MEYPTKVKDKRTGYQLHCYNVRSRSDNLFGRKTRDFSRYDPIDRIASLDIDSIECSVSTTVNKQEEKWKACFAPRFWEIAPLLDYVHPAFQFQPWTMRDRRGAF